MEAAEETGGADGHTTGRKLVPWSSWAEWRFVRDAIFPPYSDPDAALRRIAAWRSRGCLPDPVEVTASLFEIRLRDPFFRNGVAWNDKLESDEMLAFLYSMAIISILLSGSVCGCCLNCAYLGRCCEREVVKTILLCLGSPQKKTRHSISELAETVGIPRILVDIRHESSHQAIPSLRLLHLAAIKAFDWLKCTYWDSQTKAIPDARLELSSVLHDITKFLKGKDTENAKPGSKRKRSQKHILYAIKKVRRVYCTCPSEVVSVLLEFLQLDAPEISENSDVHQTDSLDANYTSDAQTQISNGDMKTIITKLSEKEPRVLLDILKSVIEMIETRDVLEHKGELYACLPAESSTMKNFCSLVLWIVTSIKVLKDSGRIGLVHEIGVLSSDKNAVPRFCLAKLLQKLLSLSVIGERCIVDAALVLIEMAGNHNVKEKLRKLPMLSLQKSPKVDRTLIESRLITNGQESVESASEKLEMFKLQLRKPDNACLAEDGTGGTLSTSMPVKHNRWSIAKSWTPCPLGMIPCSYSSTAVLPSLDVIDHELKDVTAEHGYSEHDGHTEMFDCYSHPGKQLDNEDVQVSMSPPEDEISDMPEVTSPLRGTLLVVGVWKKVTEEELLSIKPSMKFLL